MNNIKSIKKLKTHFKNIAQYNDETFDLGGRYLKEVRRNSKEVCKPFIAFKKCKYFLHKEDGEGYYQGYMFYNVLCLS